MAQKLFYLHLEFKLKKNDRRKSRKKVNEST